MQVDLAGHALVEAQPGEIVGLALAVAGFLGQPQQLAIRDQREPGIRDLRDQQQLRGVAVLLDGEVFLERGMAQAAHAAEQIQLEGRRGQAGGIDPRQLALARGRNRGRQALVVGRAAGVDGRHEIGALDAILRAGRFDVQRGDAQIAVVGEGARDEPLQLGVGKEFLPADF
jgi:hypothetical protein